VSRVLNFLNSRLSFFILFIILLNVSMMGPENAPVKDLLFAFNISGIFDIFLLSENFYRVPDTPLRFSVFIFSIIIFILMIHKKIEIKKCPKILATIFPLIVYLFISTLLITNSFYNYSAILIVLLSLYYSFYYSKNDLSSLEILFLLSYLAMFLIPFWSSMMHPTSFAEIDNYIRFILVIPIYLTLREVDVPFDNFISIVNLSSILIGLCALYCILILNETRVRGFTSSAIIFGNISLIFSLFSFLSISRYISSNKNILFPIIASGAAFFAWASTGSRGSVLLILVFLFLLFTKSFRSLIIIPKNILIIFLLIVSIVFINSPSFSRYIDSYDSTYNYLIEGSGHHWTHANSIVPRINIWQGSVNMINENIVEGVGLTNFNHSLNEQIKLKNIEAIRSFSDNPTDGQNHAHNQFLDIFAKTGVFGFFTLIFFLMIHLYFFYHRYNQSKNNADASLLSLFGIVSVIGYICYMLTHSVFSHQLSTLFMTLLFIILSGMITNKSGKY
jgi:O-antigen ligase